MFWMNSAQYGQSWDLLREFERMSSLLSGLSSPFTRTEEFPAVNVWSDGNEAVVTAELPGIDPAAADISVVGKTLTIKGSRTADPDSAGGSYHRKERWSGSFTRSIELPFLIDQNKVEAQFNKGILEIKLPRSEADKPKKITITTH
jgi:HSP20 family protein